MSAKRELARVRAPDESGAEERAWEVVRLAYRERPVLARRQSTRRVALGVSVTLLLGALALSPAGATVGRLITRALGVQHARPALFSLPSPGRILVSGPGGAWAVASDGSRRRLGSWPQASWSPRGLYVAVATGNQLAAVDPRGTLRWTLVRPRISDARWYPPTGFRIAYLSGDDLRVVAGDGSGDHPLATGVAKIAPAWRPGHAYQLAYVTRRGRLLVRGADAGRTLWSTHPGGAVVKLAWSADGERLLALSPTAVRVYGPTGKLLRLIALPRGSTALDGAFSPRSHMLALVLAGKSGDVVLENPDLPAPVFLRVLSGDGLEQLAWSPDGRWLVVTWPAADQWVFVRFAGVPRIAAVSRIAEQFSPGSRRRGFPRLDGWCCSASG